MSLGVDIAVEDARWREALPGLEALTEHAVGAALAGAQRNSKADVSLLFADDARIGALNAAFRGKSGPTNVLSFPFDAPPMPEGVPCPLGDIALAFETVDSEARTAQIPFAHHLQHLIVHGTLHLLGYDHNEEREAGIMEALETEVLFGLGVPDPYSGLVPTP